MYSNKYDKIRGRWTGKCYTLLKKLGSGGVGEIYLVEDDMGKLVALKLSQDMISITKEYNFIKKFGGREFIPIVYDIDDFVKNGSIYHFFTMEYIYGDNLKNVVKKTPMSLKSKVNVICLISKMIKEINNAGYIYTDLKGENIMIDRKNGVIKLIDLGSLTEIGTTVKEYTPMYDRACWGRGKRVADLSYQVFAIILLFIYILLGRSPNPEKENLENLINSLKKKKLPGKIYTIIRQSIDGKIKDCNMLYEALNTVKVSEFTCNRDFNLAIDALIVSLMIILGAIIMKL